MKYNILLKSYLANRTKPRFINKFYILKLGLVLLVSCSDIKSNMQIQQYTNKETHIGYPANKYCELVLGYIRENTVNHHLYIPREITQLAVEYVVSPYVGHDEFYTILKTFTKRYCYSNEKKGGYLIIKYQRHIRSIIDPANPEYINYYKYINSTYDNFARHFIDYTKKLIEQDSARRQKFFKFFHNRLKCRNKKQDINDKEREIYKKEFLATLEILEDHIEIYANPRDIIIKATQQYKISDKWKTLSGYINKSISQKALENYCLLAEKWTYSIKEKPFEMDLYFAGYQLEKPDTNSEKNIVKDDNIKPMLKEANTNGKNKIVGKDCRWLIWMVYEQYNNFNIADSFYEQLQGNGSRNIYKEFIKALKKVAIEKRKKLFLQPTPSFAEEQFKQTMKIINLEIKLYIEIKNTIRTHIQAFLTSPAVKKFIDKIESIAEKQLDYYYYIIEYMKKNNATIFYKNILKAHQKLQKQKSTTSTQKK